MTPIPAQTLAWTPGLPALGCYAVTLDRQADSWLFRELADVVEPSPWMIDIQQATVDLTVQVLADLRNTEDGEVLVLFDVTYNQEDRILRISQPVPSRWIQELAPVEGPCAHVDTEALVGG